ncbi:hypothetical protein BLA34_18360 [Ralstonia solanacearum]|nr:hypothetical protein BLA34_18360 [Ralstonia solanacearum]
MGATILVDLKTAALRRRDGSIVYFLFERTYEKNLHPHEPHWSCVAIGSYEQVLKRIFQGAAACEGGSLQGRGRDLQPEHFIRRWQRALRAPLTLPDVRVQVKPTLPFSRDDENAQYRETVAVVLASQGHPELADALRAENAITLELYADFDLVLALHGPNGVVSPWRAVRAEQAREPAAPELAPPRAREPIVAPVYGVWALDDHVRVGKFGDAPVAMLGWTYRAVGHFLIQHVYPLELQHTGISTGLIRRFREACLSAAPLPDTVHVTIRLGEIPGVHPWQRECARRIAAALGTQESALITTLGELRRTAALCDLSSLSATQLHWDEATFPPSFPGDHTSAPAA